MDAAGDCYTALVLNVIGTDFSFIMIADARRAHLGARSARVVQARPLVSMVVSITGGTGSPRP